LGTKPQHDADDENMISHQRFVLGCALELSVKAGWQLNTSTTKAPLMSPRATLGKGNFQTQQNGKTNDLVEPSSRPGQH